MADLREEPGGPPSPPYFVKKKNRRNQKSRQGKRKKNGNPPAPPSSRETKVSSVNDFGANVFNLPNHSKKDMAVCRLSLYLGSSESRKTLEQKFIFEIGTLNPNGTNERYSFLFSRHHIPTNSVVPLSAYKPTLNPQFLQSL